MDRFYTREMMMKYRTRLAEVMKQKGISRMDIVREVHVSYPTVSNWEKKALRGFDAATLKRLLEYLDIEYDDLVYEVPDES